MITVFRFSSGEPLASLNMLPDVMLAMEICVCWNMLIRVDVLVSCIQRKFTVAGRLVVVIGSSR